MATKYNNRWHPYNSKVNRYEPKPDRSLLVWAIMALLVAIMVTALIVVL